MPTNGYHDDIKRVHVMAKVDAWSLAAKTVALSAAVKEAKKKTSRV